jgi:hypothetical protein
MHPDFNVKIVASKKKRLESELDSADLKWDPVESSPEQDDEIRGS